MADITITAANVLPLGGCKTADGTAGAALTAGQVVYLDSTTGTYKLADCDSATAAVRSPAGITLNSAGTGQPIKVATSGSVTIGGTLTAGVTYYLSPTPGGIAPVADVLSGDYTVILGVATSATALKINIQESGVAI